MDNKSATLYIVATPIGNLSDISERALQTLRDCDIVACEDTRVTGTLLKRFGISKEMFVYEDSRERNAAPILLEKLKSGLNIALVSDAGTPCISDPGFRIARACRAEGIKVVPIPGPCAFAAALSASGLPSDSFLFVGFLPAKTAARRNFFEKHADFGHTLIFYESPFRLLKTLTQFAEVFGADRSVSVSREISKLHEETVRGTLEEVMAHFTQNEPKGEIVIILEGKRNKKEKETGTEV